MHNEVRPNPYTIANVKRETETEYTFKLNAQFTVNHGQFMQLSIPKFGEAPISISGFDKDSLEFTIRKVGKVTDKLFALDSGDAIFLRGPYGNGWPVEELRGRNLVVIAGGTGVSPVRSLLNMLAGDSSFAKSVHLIAGFKDQNSILFKSDLERFRSSFTTTTLALDNEELPGFRKGLVTEFIKEIPWASFGAEYSVLVVGPPVMMKFVGLELAKNNIPDENIWMSFERKMSCAIGKCGHCRIDETYVCLDGPVFNYTKAKQLVD